MALVQSGKATVMTHSKKFLSRMKQTTSWAPLNWTNLFLEARTQSTCGGCWAFSTAALVEGWIAQKFGVKKYLSPQNLISCDTSDNACNGGWYANSLAYLQTTGLALDDDIAYKNNKTDCPANITAANNTKIPPFVFCSNLNNDTLCTEQLVYSYLQQGPVAVSVDGTIDDFANYNGGIYTGPCVAQNHAVMLVGYGVDTPTGKDYWIVRNSWGTTWGELGHIRIARNLSSNFSCFVTHSAFSIPLNAPATNTTNTTTTA